MIPSYVRDGDICLVVVDLGARSSYENLDKWIDFVLDSRGPEDAIIFIVGNKSDLEEEREITTQEMEEYAAKQKYFYIEVSAKNGNNIQPLFKKVT